MKYEDFRDLIDTYGANQRRWPEHMRAPARAFIKAKPELTTNLLHNAQELDNHIESARIQPGTDILKARILSGLKLRQEDIIIPEPVVQHKSTRGFGFGSMAAMMALSFMFGLAGANAWNSDISETPTILTAENEWEDLAQEYEFDDIYEWVSTNPAP